MHEDKIITEKKKLHFEAQSLGQNIDACLVLVKKKKKTSKLQLGVNCIKKLGYTDTVI